MLLGGLAIRNVVCPGGNDGNRNRIEGGPPRPVCRGHTGRHKIVSRWDSFHGASPGAISIGGQSLFRQDAGAAAAGHRTRAAQCAHGRLALGHYTHEKSPVGAAAGLATIRRIEEDHLLEDTWQLGNYAKQRLLDMKQRHPLIADVRGLGLLLAVDLVRDGKKATDESERVMYDCLARGLSFKVSDGNVLTLSPPLTITKPELDQALDILDAVFERR